MRPASTGTWELPATDLSAAGGNALAVQVAIDPSGNVLAVWARSNGAIATVQSASRPAAGGAWQAPAEISAAGRNAISPQLAFDGQGNAVAAWSGYDGAHLIVHAADLPGQPLPGPAIAGGNPGPARGVRRAAAASHLWSPPDARALQNDARHVIPPPTVRRGDAERAHRAKRTGPTPPRHMRGSDRSAGSAARATLHAHAERRPPARVRRAGRSSPLRVQRTHRQPPPAARPLHGHAHSHQRRRTVTSSEARVRDRALTIRPVPERAIR